MNKCWFSTLNENGNSFVLSCAFTNSETQAKVKTMIKVLVVFIFFQILIYTPNSYFPRNRTWHFPCLAWRKRFSWNNRDTLFRLHDAGMYIQVQSLSNLRFWIAHCLHCICSLLWCVTELINKQIIDIVCTVFVVSFDAVAHGISFECEIFS